MSDTWLLLAPLTGNIEKIAAILKAKPIALWKRIPVVEKLDVCFFVTHFTDSSDGFKPENIFIGGALSRLIRLLTQRPLGVANFEEKSPFFPCRFPDQPE